MSEWNLVKLGDYISIKSGLAYQGSKIGNGHSYLLGMGCVSFKDKFVYSGARLYDDRGVDNSYYVSPGDIVLATRQQSDNLPILAMPAIIPQTFSGSKVIFGTNLYKVENNSEISNRFLFWLLKHQHYVSYIAGVKSGTAVQMVTKKNVENYKFYCPPKPVREKIADILWSYDDLIENNNRRIELLERAAQELYKEWFVRFRFPGHENVKFENGLPEGWKYDRLSSIMSFGAGKERPSSGSIYPVYGGNGILDYCDSYNNENAIIIGRVGAYCGSVYYEPARCWISDNALYAISKNNAIYFNYYMLKHINLNAHQVGTGQPLITQGLLHKIKTIIPSNPLINKYNSLVFNLLSQQNYLKQKNVLLEKQRDLLLPRLMSGKLEV